MVDLERMQAFIETRMSDTKLLAREDRLTALCDFLRNPSILENDNVYLGD